MISRGMMNRQLYANGPGIMGIQSNMSGPFETPENEGMTEQVVQQAINTLVNSFRVPVDTAFKYVVSVLKEVPPETLKTGGANFIVQKVSEKLKSGERPAEVPPQISNMLTGAAAEADDEAVMSALNEKQKLRDEQELQYENDGADEGISNYARGGIVSLRQNYGLGSIVKSIKGAVKGATKAVKNIVSSDIGKLALLAAGGYYLGGGTFGGFAKPFSQTAFGSSAFGQAIANPFVKAGQFLQSPSSFFTKGKTFGVDYGGKSLLKTPVKDLISQGYTLEEISKIGSMAGNVTKAGGILSGKNLLTAGAILVPSLLAGASVDEESPEDALAAQKARRDALVKAEYDPIRERLGPAYNYQTRSYSAEGGKQTQGKLRDPGIASLDVPMGKPRLNPMGTPEIDYRDNGGFVPPIGVKEKADDIPAMLSNNEFVMTAEAVGGADPLGEGDRNRGAEAMYKLMKKLENQGAMA